MQPRASTVNSQRGTGAQPLPRLWQHPALPSKGKENKGKPPLSVQQQEGENVPSQPHVATAQSGSRGNPCSGIAAPKSCPRSASGLSRTPPVLQRPSRSLPALTARTCFLRSALSAASNQRPHLGARLCPVGDGCAASPRARSRPCSQAAQRAGRGPERYHACCRSNINPSAGV